MGKYIEEYINSFNEINRRLDACGTPNAENNAVLLRSWADDIDWDFSTLSDDPLRYCSEEEKTEILALLNE